jgi:hypothetical protein
MVEWAGKGIAMENAHPKLRESADDIAQSHKELGVARYLKDYFNLNIDLS